MIVFPKFDNELTKEPVYGRSTRGVCLQQLIHQLFKFS